MRPFTYTGATTKEQALQAFHPNAHYLGGGTNLVDLMKEDVERPDQLININNLSYSKITAGANGGLTLGAMARNAETANHRDVRTNYPLLSMAMLSAATAQIRNMASNGGNLLQRTVVLTFLKPPCPATNGNRVAVAGPKMG
jgi:xanthine dehydrogenase YagS FAD-binding subunit